MSRERGAAAATAKTSAAPAASTAGAATTTSASAATRAKMNGMDLLDEDVDSAPAISSADLDQLMEDFDLNDPEEEEAIKQSEAAKAAEAAAAAAKEAEAAKEEKPGGLAGALPGGLGAGLSGIPNPMGEGNIMGKLGDLATQNPVTDVMSKGKDFLFKKFGL